VPEPLIDLATLTRRGMAATNGATILLGFAMTAFFVLVPSFVQVPHAQTGPLAFGFGASPIEAGLLMLPFSIAMLVGGPAGGALVTRRGPEWTLRTGTVIAAAALVAMTAFHATPWLLLPWLAAMGLGVALALGAIGALVIANSSAAETGVASGMNSIMRMVGAALGAQVAAALLAANALPGTAIPLERGFALGLAIAAVAALAALAPTLAFTRRTPRAGVRVAAAAAS
jgi:MFS family permease